MQKDTIYFGLKKGDVLKVDFNVLKGKPLKYLELNFFSGENIYSEFKKKEINSEIAINKTGVYELILENNLGLKTCDLKLLRIPVDEESFSTNVKWKTVTDTTYNSSIEKFLIKSDTSFKTVIDQKAKVHSTLNANGNKISTNIILPKNTVQWSYYIGVNQEGTKAYEEATQAIEKNAKALSALFPGYGPLAALLLGNASYLSKISGEDEIDFYILENNNVNLFLNGSQFYYLKKGKVVNDFAVLSTNKRSNIHLCFRNDNAVTAVFIDIKVTAMCVDNEYEEREVKTPILTKRKVPYLD